MVEGWKNARLTTFGQAFGIKTKSKPPLSFLVYLTSPSSDGFGGLAIEP